MDGRILDNGYFHWQETRYALPIFAMQNIAFGEAISLSRLGADMKLRSMHRDPYTGSIVIVKTVVLFSVLFCAILFMIHKHERRNGGGKKSWKRK